MPRAFACSPRCVPSSVSERDSETNSHDEQWDEFKSLDWQAIYDSMAKPAMVFDGRGILDAEKLRSIGFKVFSIGKGDGL